MTILPSEIEMSSIDNGNSREYLAFTSKYSLRESLILSNASSVSYYKRMEINNELSDNESSFNLVNSSQLSYIETIKMGKSVSLVTNKETASNSQHVDNKISALKRAPKPHSKSKGKQIESAESAFFKHASNNIYNIQILYNMNQAVDLES